MGNRQNKGVFSRRSDDIIEKMYAGVSYVIPQEEKELIDEQHKSSCIYGDSNGKLCRRMIRKIKIGKDDIFVDLGSGLGKVVLQVAMETNAKKVIGIELSHTRNEHAKRIYEELRKIGLKTEVHFYNDTFLNHELWKDATVVYSWAQCFASLLPQVVELAQQSPNLRYICLRGSYLEPIIKLEDYGLKRVWEKEEYAFYKVVRNKL